MNPNIPEYNPNPELMRNYPYSANAKAVMEWFKIMTEELGKAPADVDWNVIVTCATNVADLAKSNVFVQEQDAAKETGGRTM